MCCSISLVLHPSLLDALAYWLHLCLLLSLIFFFSSVSFSIFSVFFILGWTLKCTTLSGGSDAVDVVIYWTVASDLVPVPEIDSSVSEPKNRHSSKPHEIKAVDIRYDPIQVNTELEGNVVVGVGENITLSGFYEDPVNCSHRSYVWKKIRKTEIYEWQR